MAVVLQTEAQIADLTVQIEKEQQRFLVYRNEDINDLIRALRPLCLEKHEKKNVKVSALMANRLSPDSA
mgnify:CR=1 FL=1